MRKLVVLTLFLCGLLSVSLMGQQDPMFTKYMFNSLAYNPAYAGSHEHMSIGVLHRTQWINIQGAPSTQTVSMHTPLRNERVGVGINLINDKIGPTNSFTITGSYAYRIPVGKSKLAVALQGGMQNWRADWTKLNIEDQIDNAYTELMPSKTMANFGAGLYYYSKHFYAGVSVPHLIEYDLRDAHVDNDLIYAKMYRHYYFAIGGAIPVKGETVVFKPSLLIKNVGLDSKLRKDEVFRNVSAPTEFDVDLSFLFMQTFWVGGSFRSAFAAFDNERSSFDSADVWASYLLKNGLRIGAAYDYPLTKINTVSAGSFEVMLGYEFDFKKDKIVTPRYF